MPTIPFEQLPDAARVWIFGSDRPLTGEAGERLLAAVDGFLAQWKAHGAPLHCARAWTDDRFLVVGADTTRESASGCSIDGLFRVLQGLERELDATLVAGGRVFYREAAGAPRATTRREFATLAARGEVTPETPVFDTSLTTAGEYRARFERPAGDGWTASLVRR